MADCPIPVAVFGLCQISIVISKDLDENTALELQSTLEDNGAQIVPLKRDGKVKLDELTHIIAANSDFPQYREACDMMLPVVTPSWISASLVKNKQAQIRPHTPDPLLFFSGVTVTCADIPEGDKDAIIGAVMAMGGQESSALSRQVTHIVALSVDNDKCAMAIQRGMKCMIVLPHWFDDCLKLGKRIDEKPYTLPDPEILQKTASDTIKQPRTQQIEGASTPHGELPDLLLPTTTEAPSDSRRQLNVFQNKAVMLAEDLELSSRLRAVIEDVITSSGGSMTTTVYNADMFICRYRLGHDYVIASRAKKDVGSLSWLYWLMTYNEWTSPFRRLMHYPLPKGGIPGFEDTIITLSNYPGDARVYLESLVVAAGGEFTKSMRQDNTHLITAVKVGEKCAAAEEWNIEMVNHLWIEDSYAKCEKQPLSNPRYCHFPLRTNLAEVIGRTHLDENLVREKYFPEDPPESPNSKKARAAMEARDAKRNNCNPSSTKNPGGQIAVGRQLHPEFDVERDEPADVIAVTTEMFGQPVPRPRINSRTAATVTPAPSRFRSMGKENETPLSTGSRNAKNRALSKLHDLAPDVALYEKERKRSSVGGLWGGKRAADQVDRERENERRSSSMARSVEGGDYLSEDEAREVKRRKTMPKVEMRLLITGYKRWINDQNKEDREVKQLREMGVLLTHDPKNCTHLAAPSIVRTQKFLCALASGPTALSSTFIDACLDTGKVPPVEEHLLQDDVNEKRFHFKLKDAVERAKTNKRHLLGGVPVYCTADIPNGPETYKSIVEANGGIFGVYKGRGGMKIRPSGPDSQETGDPVYLLSTDTQAEQHLWEKFQTMAKQGGMEPRIVFTEWLLDVAMSQELVWNEDYLVVKIDGEEEP